MPSKPSCCVISCGRRNDGFLDGITRAPTTTIDEAVSTVDDVNATSQARGTRRRVPLADLQSGNHSWRRRMSNRSIKAADRLPRPRFLRGREAHATRKAHRDDRRNGGSCLPRRLAKRPAVLRCAARARSDNAICEPRRQGTARSRFRGYVPLSQLDTASRPSCRSQNRTAQAGSHVAAYADGRYAELHRAITDRQSKAGLATAPDLLDRLMSQASHVSSMHLISSSTRRWSRPRRRR